MRYFEMIEIARVIIDSHFENSKVNNSTLLSEYPIFKTRMLYEVMKREAHAAILCPSCQFTDFEYKP